MSACTARVMRTAFNALSVTNLSGRHVLLGHAREIIKATTGRVRHVLLYHAANRDLYEALSGAVEGIECPPATAHWPARWLWERSQLPRLLRRLGVEALFLPAGMTAPGIDLPQMVLAQNPWCSVPELHRGPGERLKARLQRSAYRRAQHEASLMLYNSRYMRQVYGEYAGFEAAHSIILHQGIEESTFAAGAQAGGFAARQCEVLTVSAMGRHKAVELVVEAIALLRQAGIPATLTLVGPWPDPAYEALVRRRIAELGLDDQVSLVGQVSRDQLHAHYARARAFCLLSRCESFGIPAIEAEAFGTPAVVADCGAPPEIAGPGGKVVPPANPAAAAAALAPLLTDVVVWDGLSMQARANAARFHWVCCSRPLVEWVCAGGHP